jgi:hypothetical protein
VTPVGGLEMGSAGIGEGWIELLKEGTWKKSPNCRIGWLTNKSKINRSYFQMLEKQKSVLRGYLPLKITFPSLLTTLLVDFTGNENSLNGKNFC